MKVQQAHMAAGCAEGKEPRCSCLPFLPTGSLESQMCASHLPVRLYFARASAHAQPTEDQAQQVPQCMHAMLGVAGPCTLVTPR